MDSNTHSNHSAGGFRVVVAELDQLAAHDPDRLTAAARAARVLVLRRLADRLEGHWLSELADLDAGGAAGAEEGIQAPSTAGWLRARLRLGAGAASSAVRTARAVFRGPLSATAKALIDGELSVAHAAVWASGPRSCPLTPLSRRNRCWWRRLVGWIRPGYGGHHPSAVGRRPEGEQDRAERRHGRRGLWLAPTWEGMVAVDGLLEAEPARPCWLPWNPWPARPAPPTPVAAASGGPMPWRSWPVGLWRGAGCPRLVGCVPS
jgi:hypothetical protein